MMPQLLIGTLCPLVLLLTAPAGAAASVSFERWTAAHGKVYATPTEHARRQKIFEANVARFAALSAVPGGAKFAADEAADLTPAEFSARFGSCSSDDGIVQPAVAAADSPATPPRSASPPTAIDWRNKDGKSFVTPVKNQGAFGTCWSFGVAENLEGLNVRQGHPLANISEQEFISCCKTCQGHKAEDSFDWLANNTGGRPALEATYPYVGKPLACNAESAPRAPVKLNSWGRVVDDGSGLPVVAGLIAHGPMGCDI